MFRIIYVATFFISATSTVVAWEPRNENVIAGKVPMSLLLNGLKESSGIAFSIVDPDCVWTHNDSGDISQILAFNQFGKYCGRATLRRSKAVDFEDMAAYTDPDGTPRLLVADVGDNDSKRDSVTLYLFDEPDPRIRGPVNGYQKVIVRYSGGSQNCESVTVDVKNNRILLFGKSPLFATMHQIPLPKRVVSKDPKRLVTEVNTKAIAKLALPMATGMDLDPKSGDLWISSYFQAYYFPSDSANSLESRLKKPPRLIPMPKLRQIEAIAVDVTGRVWVTIEGSPARMQRVTVADE